MKKHHMIPIFLLAAFVPGIAYAGTNAAAVVRSLMQSERFILEATQGAPVSWTFRTNGTFSASALTGLASWSASGKWNELPAGSFVVEGTQADARKPDEKPTAFHRVITSVEIVEKGDHFDRCVFLYEESLKNVAEGASSRVRETDFSGTTEYWRDKTALDEARKTGTKAALQRFLEEYPNSEWRGNAEYWRDKAALNEARKTGTKAALQRFLEEYPNSEWKDTAEHHLEYTAE